MFFYKSEKNMIFYVFYLQINVFNIYGTDVGLSLRNTPIHLFNNML